MGVSLLAAVAYGLICLVLCGFQAALVAGAPWGAYTQGGRVIGPLDARGRLMAFLSIPVLLFMGAAIVSAGSAGPFGWPRWTGWLALGFTVLTTVANWATPSGPERRLWGPVTLIMLACAVAALFPGSAG